MTDNDIRYYLEQSYETARKLFKLLSGENWYKYAANFPPADKLSMKSLAGLASELNEIVQSKMKEIEMKMGNKLDEQKQTISELLIDPVTGINTRKHFTNILEELTLQQLEEQPLTLIVLDINRLKHLNDTHGHSAGDEYLLTLGEAINSSLHKRDQAFRIGGDEFVIIPHISAQDATELLKTDPNLEKASIPEITLKAADVISKRILSKFQKLWNSKYNMKSGFSYGIATLYEPAIQKQITKETVKIGANNINAKDIVQIIFKLADERQYSHKEQLKKNGQYYNVNIPSEAQDQGEYPAGIKK